MKKGNTGMAVGKSKVIKSGPFGGAAKAGGKSSAGSKTSVKPAGKA